MSTKPQAKIGLGLDDKPAVKGLKAFAETWNTTFNALNQGAELLSKAFGAVAQVGGAVVDFMSEAIDAATVQERAEKKLATALQVRNQYTRDGFDALKAYASELQGLTRTGDEATLGIMAQLTAMGVQEDQLRSATRATLGLAEVTGSLEGAAKLVARTLGGEHSALKRYGVQAADTEDAMRQLTGLFRLAEKDAQTYSGRVQQLHNAWGDLLETFGFAITKSDAVNVLLEEARKLVERLNAQVADSGFGKWVDDVVRSLITLSDRGLAALANLLDLLGQMSAWVANNSDSMGRVSKVIDGLTEAVILLHPQLSIMRTWWRWFSAGDKVRAEDTIAGQMAAAVNEARESLRQLDAELSRSSLAGRFTQVRFAPKKDPPKKKTPPGKAAPYVPAGARGGISVGGADAEAAFASDDETFADRSRIVENMADAFEGSADRFARSGEKVTTTLAATRTETAGTLRSLVGFTQGFWGGVLDDSFQRLSEWGQQITDWGQVLSSTMQQAFMGLGNAVALAMTDSFEGANVAMDKQVGRILISLGQTLVATGVVAMAMGLLSLIPGLQGVTGPYGLGFAGGAAATGIGAGLIAAGVAMGGGNNNVSLPSTKRPGMGSASRAPTGSGVGGGLNADGPQQPQTTIVYNNFGPGSAMNPRRSARDLRRAMGY